MNNNMYIITHNHEKSGEGSDVMIGTITTILAEGIRLDLIHMASPTYSNRRVTLKLNGEEIVDYRCGSGTEAGCLRSARLQTARILWPELVKGPVRLGNDDKADIELILSVAYESVAHVPASEGLSTFDRLLSPDLYPLTDAEWLEQFYTLFVHKD